MHHWNFYLKSQIKHLLKHLSEIAKTDSVEFQPSQTGYFAHLGFGYIYTLNEAHRM